MHLQKIVLASIAVLVIGGGVLGYMLTEKKGGAENVEIDNQSGATPSIDADREDSTAKNITGNGSLLELIGLGQSISCTYTYTDAEMGEGSGTGFFDNGRMRIDYQVTEGESTFDGHMINDGKRMYSWSASPEGSFAMVMDVSAEEGTDEQNAEYDTETEGMESLEEDVNYDCKRWHIEESRFIPPTDIEFTDMSAMLERMHGGAPMPQ